MEGDFDHRSSTERGRGSRLARIVHETLRHRVELGFVIATIAVMLALPFLDSFDLKGNLLAASYFAVGRNPYDIFSYPPPPVLAGAFLPVFGAYAASDYNLAVANFALKALNLASLLIVAFYLGRLAGGATGSGVTGRAVRRAVLLSPLLFFVSFVWGESDLLGLAPAFAGLFLLANPRGTSGNAPREAAGIGLLAVAAFTYYFPLLLFPTVLAFSPDRRALGRRLLSSALALGALATWFLILPGWDFLSRSATTAATGVVSPFSILILFGPGLGAPTTGLQSTIAVGLLGLLVALELLVPVLLRWRAYPWTLSAAIAITLPFLALNVVNGDEWVWPLPFLMLALAAVVPGRRVGLWLLQAYALPVIVTANLINWPGPGAGTGIYYWSYPFLHQAVPLFQAVPQYGKVVELAALVEWLSLVGILGFLLFRARRARVGVASGSTGLGGGPESRPPWTPGRSGRPGPSSALSPPGPRSGPPVLRRAGPIIGVVALVALLTAIAAAAPAPTLSVNGSQQFPLGLFQAYAVSNASVSYTLAGSGNVLAIAPSYGNTSVLGTPWETVGFSRNVSGESVRARLSILPSGPASLPANASVLAYGPTDFNLVTPFDPPPPSAALVPAVSVNVTPLPDLASAQFVRAVPGAGSFNGSSYERFDATPLEGPNGQLTLYFRWAGIQLDQNLVVAVYRGPQVFEVFGEGGIYTAGEKPGPSQNWTFSAPRLTNAASWQQLTITNASTGTEIALNGLLLPLPLLAAPFPSGSSMVVGEYSPGPKYFQSYDFYGDFLGPYNTTASSPSVGAPQICPWSAASPDFTARRCAPLGTGDLELDIGSNGSAHATVGPTTYPLTGTPPVLELGRLSPVGPGLAVQIRSLTLTTDRSALGVVWLVDGVVVPPLLCGLLAGQSSPGVGPAGPTEIPEPTPIAATSAEGATRNRTKWRP